jgi:hypothetical protein
MPGEPWAKTPEKKKKGIDVYGGAVPLLCLLDSFNKTDGRLVGTRTPDLHRVKVAL